MCWSYCRRAVCQWCDCTVCVCVGVHAPVLVQEADVLSWVKMIQEEMLVQHIFFSVSTPSAFSQINNAKRCHNSSVKQCKGIKKCLSNQVRWTCFYFTEQPCGCFIISPLTSQLKVIDFFFCCSHPTYYKHVSNLLLLQIQEIQSNISI